MQNFFHDAAQRVGKYSARYIRHPRFAALKLAVWSIGRAFKKLTPLEIWKLVASWCSRCSNRCDDNVRVLFEMQCGIGDTVVFANYIWHFVQFVDDKNMTVDVLAHNMPFVHSFFKENSYVKSVYTAIPDRDYKNYDVWIILRRFPRVMHVNSRKKINKNLSIVIDELTVPPIADPCENANLYSEFFDVRANILCRIKKLNRLQQPDITQLLNVEIEYKAPIPINVDEDECLKKFQLYGKKIITLSRECGSMLFSEENTRMWALENYFKLVELLKQETDKYVIVQIGSSAERSKLIGNIDVDLRGKTSLEEVKILLKHSSLHIDIEGGMVHMRHALHAGPSVVLFGPTDIEMLGYPENINIKSPTNCCFPCEWVTHDWNSKCIRDDAPRICMRSIIPNHVMSRIREEFLNAR